MMEATLQGDEEDAQRCPVGDTDPTWWGGARAQCGVRVGCAGGACRHAAGACGHTGGAHGHAGGAHRHAGGACGHAGGA